MKRKLRLEPETLRVESFGTVEGDGSRGTVRAHGYTEPDYPSCARTCGASPPPDTSLCYREGPTLKACCL
ncbi:MAG TPA: hypothetical protein VF541_12185 [Longimicrobium sp.]|jgi:hypothetical protein